MQNQIEFEEQCLKRDVKSWITGSQGQVAATSAIIKDRLLEVSESLKKTSKNLAGTAGRYNKILADVVVDGDFNSLSYIGLTEIFGNLSSENADLTKIIINIGKKVEDHYRFMLFEKEHKGLFDLIKKDLKSRNSKKYEHAKTVFGLKMNDKMEWDSWNIETTVHIGNKIVAAILEVYSDILEIKMETKNNRNKNKIVVSGKYSDWKELYIADLSYWNIKHMPMMEPPLEWKENLRGGWYSYRMQINIIKWHSKAHKEKTFIPEEVKRALNKQQNTSWIINTKMLGILQELINSQGIQEIQKYASESLEPYPSHFNKNPSLMLPEEHTEFMEWKRKRSKVYGHNIKVRSRVLSISRILRLVEQVKDWETLYFPYNCDWVGRMYCNGTYLNTQGSDLERSLLDFKTSVKVSERGKVWIKRHQAKMFGIKGTEKELLLWWEENKQMIEGIKKNPEDFRWTLAKKPFSFLRACQEDFVTSNLPVGIDGVCNGLQHYAALFRDDELARNLGMTTNKPTDIYSILAESSKNKLKQIKSIDSYTWLNIGVNRELLKKPTMLLSYGITVNSLIRKLMDISYEKSIGVPYESCKFMGEVIWETFRDHMKAVIEGMNILKDRVPQGFMEWESPTGFKIFQPYFKKKEVIVKVTIGKPIKIRLSGDTSDCNNRKQKQAFPANYIHSFDAAHAVRIINEYPKDIRAIHDEFAVHCNHVDKLQTIIKDTFVKMYENVCEKKIGNLQLDSINSKYFFY